MMDRKIVPDSDIETATGNSPSCGTLVASVADQVTSHSRDVSTLKTELACAIIDALFSSRPPDLRTNWLTGRIIVH